MMNSEQGTLEVVKVLLIAALSGASVVEMILLLRSQKLVGENELIKTIYFLCKAFELQVGDAKIIGAWQGFNGGVMTDAEIEGYLKHKIDKFVERIDREYAKSRSSRLPKPSSVTRPRLP